MRKGWKNEQMTECNESERGAWKKMQCDLKEKVRRLKRKMGREQQSKSERKKKEMSAEKRGVNGRQEDSDRVLETRWAHAWCQIECIPPAAKTTIATFRHRHSHSDTPKERNDRKKTRREWRAEGTTKEGRKEGRGRLAWKKRRTESARTYTKRKRCWHAVNQRNKQ